MPFANNQGTKIFYKVEGDGPPLLMIHGFPNSQESFFECGYVAALKETYQLILMDMRGYGQSDKLHDAEGYSFRIMVEDIIAVLDDLKVDHCHIYGHSMGGWFIYGLAIYYPDRLQSVIISDGVPGSGDPKLLRDLTESLDQFVAANTDMSPGMKKQALENDRQALFAMSDWLVEEIPSIIKDINDVVDKINVPTLILMSNLPTESEEYQLLHKSKDVIPNAKLVHFEDLTHFGLFKNGDRILPHIKDFLGSI